MEILMGSKDLHHRRKQRKVDSLKRKEPTRKSDDIVLIVCEGKKTEPYYINDFREEKKLNKNSVQVIGHGKEPMALVNYAIEKYSKYRDYDKIYCVFDQDEHIKYQSALDEIKLHQQKGIPIHAIISIPCFELWLLLHFEFSTRAYRKEGKKSAGDQLCSKLKEFIPDYTKGHQKIYDITKSNLAIAVKNAKIIADQQSINGDNPSTNFFQLIEDLTKLI
jgi:hypothetical protein